MLIWGDDQYENFKEDVVPPFCVYLYDQLDCLPYQASRVINTPRNVWDQPTDKVVPVRGHREAASYLARELILDQFDVAYAYKPHHHPTLAHAFMRTIMYLDYDQRGFDYPVIPFHVNCYGSDLMNRPRCRRTPGTGLPAPPAPTPRRCFDLGRAGGPHPRRQSLAGGADRLLVVVARLPDEEALRPLPRRGVRPPAAGRAAGRAGTRSGATSTWPRSRTRGSTSS